MNSLLDEAEQSQYRFGCDVPMTSDPSQSLSAARFPVEIARKSLDDLCCHKQHYCAGMWYPSVWRDFTRMSDWIHSRTSFDLLSQQLQTSPICAMVGAYQDATYLREGTAARFKRAHWSRASQGKLHPRSSLSLKLQNAYSEIDHH